MSRRMRWQTRRHLKNSCALLLCALVMAQSALVLAGGFNNFRNPSVGGISINVYGVVAEPLKSDRNKLLKKLREEIGKAPQDLNAPTGLRMISLRGLEAAIEDAHVNNLGKLPDEVQFLAGLQRIEYVFLYPEANDIVIAGPGDGWRIDEKANVVGLTTGRPIILLDDLLVAFRNARNAAQGHGISCSIDPTAEGRQKLNAYLAKQTTFNRGIPAGVERALGPQQVSITGVPADSHFARVMVAADYQMKRFAMDLEAAPVKGMPSFVDMMAAKRAKLGNMMPRWWLACNYEPVARSEDGLAWQLRGNGVKAMTEDDFISAAGAAKGTGRANPMAQQWADTMTEKYDELTAKEPIFGELRNLMDLCVVAALIERHHLLDEVNLDLPLIRGSKKGLSIDKWLPPKTIATQCSFQKVGREYIITASGGVQVESWAVARETEMSADVEQVRTRAKAVDKKNWWWNS